jgi:outer membrane protein TolC
VELATLNRLRGRTEDAPIPTTASLDSLSFPPASPVADQIREAEARSPELQAAQEGVKQAELGLVLAKRDRYPDFAVSAALMPRGGLDPMWYAGVSISLPVWSKQKQQRAVAEQEWRRKSQGSESESVRNLLVQRTRERAAELDSVLGTLRIYREGLLVQSEATFQATLAQYETGGTPFLSVLEALDGWVADQSGQLQALAQAESIRIAQAEYNLSGTPVITSPGLGSASLAMGGAPSGGASGPASSSKSGAASAQGGGGASSNPM